MSGILNGQVFASRPDRRGYCTVQALRACDSGNAASRAPSGWPSPSCDCSFSRASGLGARMLLAQPGGRDILAIEVGGVDADARDGAKRRQPIDTTNNRPFVDAAGRHVTWPADDEGDAHAPFIHAMLAAAQLAGISHGVQPQIGRIVPTLLANLVFERERRWSLVAGKDHDGILAQAQLVDPLQQSTDVFVHRLNVGQVTSADARSHCHRVARSWQTFLASVRRTSLRQ